VDEPKKSRKQQPALSLLDAVVSQAEQNAGIYDDDPFARVTAIHHTFDAAESSP